MANAHYGKGLQKFLEGGINWSADTIKAALVKSTYTPDLATHEFLTDLGANRVGTDQTLGTKTTTLGVADAADVLFSAVASGSTITYVAIYKDTGTAATSPLIFLIDTAGGAPGLPVATNGGDIPITWDNGANKIFKL